MFSASKSRMEPLIEMPEWNEAYFTSYNLVHAFAFSSIDNGSVIDG